MEELKMKEKIINFLFIIICIASLVLGIYMFVFYNAADKTEIVMAYENINDYPVYDGRNVYEYWKETLNEEQQILYEEIKESYLQFKNDFSTQLNEISTKEFQEVYSAILLDHAEIFWLDSYDNVQVDLLMN